MSDAFLAARPSTQAASDAHRPQRPPRRVSHFFNDVSDEADPSLADASHASSSSTAGRDGNIAAGPQSHIQRFVRGSTSQDTDVDRTPTRVSHRSEALHTRASKASLRKDWQGTGDQQDQQVSRGTGRISTLPASSNGDDASLSAPRLRHQSSSTTIRSSERANEHDTGASASTTRPNESPRSERQKRSARYEEEIQQMRSESRLASRDGEDEDDRERSFGRTAYKANDTTDTSGTEGSGPVIGNRRRKKSSASSSGKKAAARAAQGKEHHSSPPKKYSPRKDRLPSSSAGPFHSSRSPFATLTSPLRTESALEFTSSHRSPTSRRLPLPNEFQNSRYRSDAMVDDSYPGERRRNSIDDAAREGLWPRGEVLPPKSYTERREERRQRHVSESPVLDSVESSRLVSTRGSTSNGTGRVSENTGGTSQYLPRQSKYGSLTEGQERGDRASGNRSLSDLMRQRKISTSSSVSQRSSGAPSDPNRPSSRVSLRRNYGRDVFDDGSAPPLPEHSLHPLSPRYRVIDVQQEQQSQAMAQALREKQERIREARTTRGEDWQREVDELQKRIDQLGVAATSSRPPDRETHSRSSSRASASAPRSSTSNVSSTPSMPTNRRANRPSTEPRNVRGHRGASEMAPGERNESVSRLGVWGGERKFPVTPNMADLRAVSGSRLASGTHSSVGRYSSVGQQASRSLSASTGSGPLHERNLLNSVDSFERFYLDARKIPLSGSLSASTAGNASETVELVNRFRETSDTAISINKSLRQLLQGVVECAIDAEVDTQDSDSAALLNDIDKSLSAILRDSDEQIRSLTEGLLALTRAEKERDRLRRMTNEQSSLTGAATPRSVSRMASLGLSSQLSPERDRSRVYSQGYSERRPSVDLRKSISIRDRDQKMTTVGGGGGAGVGIGNSSVVSLHAGENRSQTSDRSSESRNSGDSGGHHRRRYTVLNESHGSSSTASGKSPSYPYSPSPNPSSAHAAGSNVQSMRRGNTSPSLDMHLRKAAVSEADHNGISHARSASELNLKHAFSAGLDSLIQRSPLLRRDKTSSASVQTVRGTASAAAFPPPSLSPRRPRLSFPKVSAIAVEATSSNQSTSDNGDDLSSFSSAGGAAAGGRDEVD